MIGKSWRILHARTLLAIELAREAAACTQLFNVCMAGIDPLLTFALSAVERQVTKYSGRSKRLLDAKSLAKAARHNI